MIMRSDPISGGDAALHVTPGSGDAMHEMDQDSLLADLTDKPNLSLSDLFIDRLCLASASTVSKVGRRVAVPSSSITTYLGNRHALVVTSRLPI